MPKFSPESGDVEAVREFEDFLINCDKTQSLSTLLKDMLKVAIPDKTYDDVIINYAVDALNSVNIEAYVKDESGFIIDKSLARATWATIATQIAKKYDSAIENVITAATFLEAIKPYLK